MSHLNSTSFSFSWSMQKGIIPARSCILCMPTAPPCVKPRTGHFAPAGLLELKISSALRAKLYLHFLEKLFKTKPGFKIQKARNPWFMICAWCRYEAPSRGGGHPGRGAIQEGKKWDERQFKLTHAVLWNATGGTGPNCSFGIIKPCFRSIPQPKKLW